MGLRIGPPTGLTGVSAASSSPARSKSSSGDGARKQPSRLRRSKVLPRGLGIPLRSARFAIHRLLRRSDAQRWSSAESLSPEWDERTRRLAALVQPRSRVLELGAGRRRLEEYLPPGCTYVPCDIVSRGSDTIVFDLNDQPRPNLIEVAADVAVIGGTLEYVHDLPSVAKWLAGSVAPRCICTYAPARARRRSLGRVWESFLRTSNGWMNTVTEDELLNVFANAGYHCVHRESWGVQRVFVFDQRRGRSDEEVESITSEGRP